MQEMSSRVGTSASVRTRGRGTAPRQAAPGLFFGPQGAEPFALPEALTIWYYVAGVLTTDVIAAGSMVRIWTTDQATTDASDPALLDNLTNAYRMFSLPGSGSLYAALQQDYPAIATALPTLPLYDLAGRTWKRAQLLKGGTVPTPATPAGVCFVNHATIRLVAGGTIGAPFDSFTPTDGPLGTNVITSPFAMCLGFFDGLVYFNDNSVNLRTWDTVGGDVATSTFDNLFWNGGYWVSFNSGLCFAPDGTGRLFSWGVQDADEPVILLGFSNADGSFAGSMFAGNAGGTELNVNLEDNSANASIFVGRGGDLGAGDKGLYLMITGARAVSPDLPVTLVAYLDLSTNHDNDDLAGEFVFVGGVFNPPGGADPTNFYSPTTSTDASAPAGTSATDQGEGEGVVQPLLGDIGGMCVGPDGTVYTVAADVGMVRRMRLDSFTHLYNGAESLSNHTAVPFTGGAAGSAPTGFRGDGGPAYTAPGLGPAQFSGAHGIALTDCGGQLILDGNDLIRHIDPAGNLFTVAGDTTLSGALPFPDATPADALTRRIHAAKILAVGNGDYLVSQIGDGETIPDALYLLHDHKICISRTPSVTIVAGGVAPDESDDQTDGPPGINVVQGARQMAWGPDGKLWFISTGSPFLRTYDPTTGQVATTALEVGGTTNIGLAFAADGTIFAMSLDDSDEPTPQVYTFAPGATDMSGLVGSPRFFGEYGGQAALVMGIAVLTAANGDHFVFLLSPFAGEVDMWDPVTDILHQGFAGNSLEPISANPPTEDVGEGVAGIDGSLGQNASSLAVTPSGNLVVGSYGNQMVREITIDFVPVGEDGDRTQPNAVSVRSITNHSLDRGAGDGGDGAPAFTLGDYGPQFNGVSAVAVDACGNYFILDNNNHKLRMVDTSGVLRTIAGNGSDGSSGPVVSNTSALGTSVSIGLFDSTMVGALLVDPAGGVYVANQNAILKVEG